MTITTTRNKLEYTRSINTYTLIRTGLPTSTGDYPSQYLMGKAQSIIETDKVQASRRFKSMGKKGLVINPVTITLVECEGDVVHLTAVGSKGTEIYRGNMACQAWLAQYFGFSTPFEATPSWLAPYATQKAYAKMGSPEVVDFGQALGELTETIQFLRNPVKGLLEYATKHQRAVTRKLLKRRTTRSSWGLDAKAKATLTADVLADSFLAHSYGYQPLMSDLDGITSLATQQALAINDRIRSVGGVVEADGVPYTGTSVKILEHTPMLGYFKLRRQSKFKASTKLFYKYKPWMHDAIWLSRYGLSPTQFLSTAWAVLPGSFIVDWALDVSTWLKALEPKPQLEHLGGCTSFVTIEEASNHMYQWQSSTGINPTRLTFKASLPGGYTRRKQLRRTTIVPLSLTPVWTRKFEGFSKTLAAISLLWSFRPKILRRGLVFQDFGL